ncbi:fibroblast growth factor 2-like [Paramuricea clavata]|uniref:Fibroblast growth factor 2-like n=1 Tax=Paramuricea clavata TaxID=317549 RepID=A0A7D9IZT4_PARCT|nr:fibroblast growth factor 2-like [Paramuricea clavata]
MTNRIIIKRGSTRIFPEPSTSRRAALFLILFLVYELYIAVEAKSTARMNALKNVTLVSKTGRYLTIGKQGITAQYSNSPYAELEIHTVGFNGEISIKGIRMGKYLAMNTTGNVTLVTSETKDAVFIDLRKITTPFISIRSKPYPSKYLYISASGSVMGCTNTSSDNTMYMFTFT